MNELIPVQRQTLEEMYRLLKEVRDQNMRLRNDKKLAEITITYRSHLRIDAVEKSFEKVSNLLGKDR